MDLTVTHSVVCVCVRVLLGYKQTELIILIRSQLSGLDTDSLNTVCVLPSLCGYTLCLSVSLHVCVFVSGPMKALHVLGFWLKTLMMYSARCWSFALLDRGYTRYTYTLVGVFLYMCVNWQRNWYQPFVSMSVFLQYTVSRLQRKDAVDCFLSGV